MLGLEVFPAPGHASHQVSYLASSGRSTPGDAAGVRIAGRRVVLPSCPPPEIDLDAWLPNDGRDRAPPPGRLALMHYGAFEDVESHLAAFRETLGVWTGRVGNGMVEETFIAEARYDVAQVDREEDDTYAPPRRSGTCAG